MEESAGRTQLVNKLLISLPRGQVLGFITSTIVEVEEGQYFFVLKVKKTENVSDSPRIFTEERKIRIKPEDIVNVGPDVVIIGDGKVPPLREIEEMINKAKKYEEVVRELEIKERLIRELKEETTRLQRRIEELERELRKYLIMKEDFENLKEQLLRQEGQLEMAREYAKSLEKMTQDVELIKSSVLSLINSELEKIVRSVVDEELNVRGLKKSGFL